MPRLIVANMKGVLQDEDVELNLLIGENVELDLLIGKSVGRIWRRAGTELD